jgi:ABC-type nickel/cobalt efflux system permease component RcnA
MHVFRSYAFIPEPKAALLETHPKDWAIYDAKSVALMITFAPEALAGLAAPPSALPGGVPATPPSAAEGMRKKAEEEARLRGVDYRGSEELAEGRRFLELRDTTWYIAIGLALLWGAAHALAPGHGKSMVAAYLLGTEGRIGDAIALGGIVTLTHAGSIFLIAMFAFFLAERVFGVSEHAVQAYSAIGLEIASGVLVAAIGLGIFAKRLRQYRRGEALADHAHGPGGHAHDHGPEHRHPKVGEGRDLISLGFAAGLQPCTAGLMLVGMSIAQGWLWKGLYLLLAFSLGLGAVLVAVAVSMVLGKKLLAERIDTSEGSFVRTVLPLVSAACLAAVGVFIVVDCLIRNKIL